MRHKIRKQPLTPAQYAARFAAEKARLARRYSDAFGLWRACAKKQCRRDGGCRGDANACLERAIDAVPHAAQWQARQQILSDTPANIGAPERAARQCLPREFYAQMTAAVAGEVASADPWPRR